MNPTLLGAGDYYVLLEVFILLAVAQLLHSITRKLGFPEIVADLLAGMVIGSYALGGVVDALFGIHLFEIGTGVLLFANLSVVLLLFSAGLGAGFSSLRKAGLKAVSAAIAGDVVPFVLILVVFSRFYSMNAALMIAVAGAATSTAVAAALLRSEHLETSEGAQFLLNVAALDDVVALVILSVVLAIVGGETDAIVLTGSVLASVIAWVVLLLASVVIVPRLLRARLVREAENLPFTFLFLLIAVVLALGFSPVIGAYIAGLAVAESWAAARTRELTTVLVAVFGSLFFIVVGAEFDVGLLADPSLVLLALLLTGTAAVGKVVGVYPLARRALGGDRPARAVAAGMIPRGEIGLIVGAIGFTSGILTEKMLGEVVVMAILTTLVGAILFPRLSGAFGAPSPEG